MSDKIGLWNGRNSMRCAHKFYAITYIIYLHTCKTNSFLVYTSQLGWNRLPPRKRYHSYDEKLFWPLNAITAELGRLEIWFEFLTRYLEVSPDPLITPCTCENFRFIIQITKYINKITWSRIWIIRWTKKNQKHFFYLIYFFLPTLSKCRANQILPEFVLTALFSNSSVLCISKSDWSNNTDFILYITLSFLPTLFHNLPQKKKH